MSSSLWSSPRLINEVRGRASKNALLVSALLFRRGATLRIQGVKPCELRIHEVSEASR